MVDRALAGYETIGTHVPFQLWAGEPNGQSTQGTCKAGYKFGQQDANGQTVKVGIVAKLADGDLVPYNAAGADGSEVAYGFLPHYLDTTATGINAPEIMSVFISGHPNIDAMDIGASSYQEIKVAFAGTMVNPQRLW